MSTDPDRRQHRRLQLRARALLELPQSTPPCQGALPGQVPSVYQVLGLHSGEKAEARAS
jgi:hypothetical protein